MKSDHKPAFEYDPLTEVVIGCVLLRESQCTYLPPGKIFHLGLTEKGKRAIEPPMNTDEHRLKDDEKKSVVKNLVSIFIMSLSVCIGVYRWLKNLCFNWLNQPRSVDAFVGACDASVS
jgi:hypothetical protein